MASEEISRQCEAVQMQAKAFFDSLQVSSTKVSQLGNELLEEIDELERVLAINGATGFSLLVGSKDVRNAEAVDTKLKEMEKHVREKEFQRQSVHVNAELLTSIVQK